MRSPEDSPGDGRDTPEPTETTTGEPDHARYEGRSDPRLSPALIATLITIPIMLIVGFIAFAALKSSDQQQIPVDSYAAPASADGRCATLIAALPGSFEGFGAKQVDGGTATWKGSEGGDPVTVRCGVDRPSELAPSSRLQTVNGVQWFITDTIENRGQAYVCVDHRPYVALWVPVSGGNSSITDVSAAIGRVLPTGPLDFG
ncbi:DUF3515 domain-containing protein [Gordonia oryzae]|uniref:DUF3515 domain-containing protein n=1 Tax=Gordonia oryzae TaxID=2487349 RepID=A0A3N4GHA4_9ACTN|nr:DUF3515 domain-containing protein [Gordonia oryzae]RPA62219.1 DUF3515 domain-containing protein [Gordonia oryzae]